MLSIYTNPIFQRHDTGPGHPENAARMTHAAEGVSRAGLASRLTSPPIDVDASDDPFPENAWVGSRLAFGDRESGPRASVTELDERCAMINLDPHTGISSPAVLRTVVRERGNRAGVYAVPTCGGRISVGDVAFVS